MINNENLDKLYERVLRENEVTIKELNDYGFTTDDITTLLNDGTLSRTQDNYALSSVDKLFEYGYRLLISKRKKEAYKCFKLCYKIDSNHYGTCFQLFYKSIVYHNFKDAFSYLKKLESSNQQDFNTFLFLLSFIVKLPKEYQEKVNSMVVEDLKVSLNDTRYEDIEEHNQIRELIFSKKFKPALSKLNLSLFKPLKSSKDIIKSLLVKVIKINQFRKDKIIKLIREENYEKLVGFLSEIKERNALNKREEYILIIARKMLEIRRASVRPKVGVEEPTDIFSAIKSNNYEYALKNAIKFNYKNSVENDKDSLYLILVAITNEINKIKEDNILILKKYLLANEVKKALEILELLLNKLNKDEYKSLAILLIKLSILQKDSTFTYITSFLEGLEINQINVDVNKILNVFDNSLNDNNFELANLVIDIIKKLEELKLLLKLSNYLLEKLKNKASYLDEMEVLPNEINEEYKEIRTEIDFLGQKYQELKENGKVIILSPKDSLNFDTAEFNKRYSDAEAFIIGLGMDKKVVIKSKGLEDINKNKLKKAANGAYNNEQLNDAISKYEKLLLFDNNILIYARLGLLYLKKNNVYDAVLYLTIATDLAEQHDNLDYNFTSLINKILKKTKTSAEENTKSAVKMSVREFSNDLNEYYGIEKLGDVSILINYQGMSVDEACKALNIGEDDRNMIILLIAREYYALNNLTMGDKYSIMVEKRPNKSLRVKKLLEQLRVNRRFYQNRVDDDYKPLLLKR